MGKKKQKEKQLRKEFEERFDEEYSRIHAWLTPITKRAQEDEVMQWALFAQCCNLLVWLSVGKWGREKGTKIISEGINKSLSFKSKPDK